MQLGMTQDHFTASWDGPSGLQLNEKHINVTAVDLFISTAAPHWIKPRQIRSIV